MVLILPVMILSFGEFALIVMPNGISGLWQLFC